MINLQQHAQLQPFLCRATRSDLLPYNHSGIVSGPLAKAGSSVMITALSMAGLCGIDGVSTRDRSSTICTTLDSPCSCHAATTKVGCSPMRTRGPL